MRVWITTRRNPIVLPDECHLTYLLVHKAHVRFGHVGGDHVRAELRTKFWVLKSAKVVSRVLKGCFTCRKLFAFPVQQKMSGLPEDRVVGGDPVFPQSGLDCFGPMLVKRGRAQCKRYGLIFTCLTVRAVIAPS